MIGPGRPGLARAGRKAVRRVGVRVTPAVPARRFRARRRDLTAGLAQATGRADLPGPVVTRRLPGPVTPGPEAARTRMGEPADALEEP